MSRKKSIVILTVIAILIILGTVFACVPLDKGELGRYDYTNFVSAIKLGLDLKGGVYAVYEAQSKDAIISAEEFQQQVEGTARNLQSLLFSKGYTESVVSTSGNRIRVEVPDVEDPERIFQLIGRPAELEFKLTDAEGNITDDKVLVSGKNIKRAYVSVDENNQYVVAIEFNDKGRQEFADATTQAKGGNLGIFIGGTLYMNPTVSDTITNGTATISRQGGYEYNEAYEMAVQLQAGSLAVNLKLSSSGTISPTLGEQAVTSGLIACLVGIGLVFIFMIAYYRMLGVAADIALALYFLALLFFYAIFPWVQLTLPGIAGIVLGIGMAVDANIIIFERIKGEYRTNKTLRSSVDIGFKKSLSAILDGNITTLLGAAVLWLLGPTTIQGFAITLIISIVLSMFSSLVLTRLFVKCFLSFNDKKGKLFGLKRKKETSAVNVAAALPVKTAKEAE